jgi:hypothetical protein
LNESEFSFELLRQLENNAKERKVKNAIADLKKYLSEKCSIYYSDYRYKEYYLTSDVHHNFFLDGIKKNLEERMKIDIQRKSQFCERLYRFEKLIKIYQERHVNAQKQFDSQILCHGLKPIM